MCNSYFFSPLALGPIEYKDTSGSRGTEATGRFVIRLELQTDQVAAATCRRYQVQSPSQLPTSTHTSDLSNMFSVSSS